MKINIKYNYKEKKRIRTYLLCPYLSLIFQTIIGVSCRYSHKLEIYIYRKIGTLRTYFFFLFTKDLTYEVGKIK